MNNRVRSEAGASPFDPRTWGPAMRWTAIVTVALLILAVALIVYFRQEDDRPEGPDAWRDPIPATRPPWWEAHHSNEPVVSGFAGSALPGDGGPAWS